MDAPSLTSPPLTQSQILQNPRVICMLQEAASASNPTQMEEHTSKSNEKSVARARWKKRAFREGLQSLQRDDTYNVTIVCKGRRFNVTVDVLECHNSCLISVPQTVHLHHIIVWDHEEVWAVERFIDYLYNFDYGPRSLYSTPTTGESPWDSEIHIVMYKLAAKLDLPILKRKAKLHFDCELTRIMARPNMDELLEVVPLVYNDNTTPQRTGLFDLQSSLVQAWARMSAPQVQSLEKEGLKELFRKCPEFSVDLLLHHSRTATSTAPRKRLQMEEDQSLEPTTSPES